MILRIELVRNFQSNIEYKRDENEILSHEVGYLNEKHIKFGAEAVLLLWKLRKRGTRTVEAQVCFM